MPPKSLYPQGKGRNWMGGWVGQWNSVDEVAGKKSIPIPGIESQSPSFLSTVPTEMYVKAYRCLQKYISKYFLRRRVSVAPLTTFDSKIVFKKSFDKMLQLFWLQVPTDKVWKWKQSSCKQAPSRFDKNDPQEWFRDRCGPTELSWFKAHQMLFICCRMHNYLQLQWKYNSVTRMRGGKKLDPVGYLHLPSRNNLKLSLIHW
jgi:hypothetical protein